MAYSRRRIPYRRNRFPVYRSRRLALRRWRPAARYAIRRTGYNRR